MSTISPNNDKPLSAISTITGNSEYVKSTGGLLGSVIGDGTNTASVLKSDGTVAGGGNGNSMLTAPGVQIISFTTSTPGAQVLLAGTDVSHYQSIEVVFSSVGTGLALTGQFAPTSITTYVSISSWASGTGGITGNIGTSANINYYSPVRGNFFQLNVTALTSGTLSGTVTLRTTALLSAGIFTIPSSTATNATNTSGGTVANSNIMAQFDDVAPTSITENFFGNLRMSANRNLYNTLRDAAGNERGANIDAANRLGTNSGLMPLGTQLVAPYSLHSTTNATTTPTASTAYISSIVVSTVVAGTTSTITIKDKSGTPLTLIPGDATTTVGKVTHNFQTPVLMTSGIDIVTAGAVAATVDIWVNYFQ